jgi:hypothetical protein
MLNIEAPFNKIVDLKNYIVILGINFIYGSVDIHTASYLIIVKCHCAYNVVSH